MQAKTYRNANECPGGSVSVSDVGCLAGEFEFYPAGSTECPTSGYTCGMSDVPAIEAVSPNPANLDAVVTVSGRELAQTADIASPTIIIDDRFMLGHAIVVSSTSLAFKLESNMTSGTHRLAVKTDRGTSNAVSLTVISPLDCE